MTSTTKGIITVLVVGGIGYLAYKKLFQDNKKKYAQAIVLAGKSSNFDKLITFGEDYLKAWDKAIKNKAETFSLNGSTYKTQGGTKIN